jgi:hypothetical protein
LAQTHGTITDSSGIFFIQHDDSPGSPYRKLYRVMTADTITISDTKELKIVLASGKQLSEVKVYAKQTLYLFSCFKPYTYTGDDRKELFKARLL